jgi:AraC-like DNA-binding protein
VSEGAGVAPNDLLSRAGLDESREVVAFADFGKPERKHWASTESVFAVWDGAIEAQQGSRFMFELVASLLAEGLGTLGFLMLTSSTLDEGLSHFAKGFELVTNSGNWERRSEGDRATFVWKRVARTAGQCAANESMFAHLIHILKDVAGEAIRPVQVRFQHRPMHTRQALAELLPCPIEYEAAENSLSLPREVLHAKPRLAHPSMARYFRNRVDQGLELVRSTYGVVDVLRHELRRCPGLDQETVVDVAERMGLSVRTLQRRLDESGTSFSSELERERRERALRLVTTSGLGIAEIAKQLGFTDASAFSRAFRRWYAAQPSALRKVGA